MDKNESALGERGTLTTQNLNKITIDSNEAQAMANAALLCLEKGFSVLPTGPDKRPLLQGWKRLQKSLMTQNEARQYFDSEARLAIICGTVSGNLECMDLDNPGTYDPFLEILEQQCPGLSRRLLHRRTVSGGYHLIYKSASPVSASKILAADVIAVDGPGDHACSWRPTGKFYKAKRIDGRWVIEVTAIETRGEGGYFLAYPSPGYEIITGDLADCQVLTDEEVSTLHTTAQAFDMRLKKEKEIPPRVNKRSASAKCELDVTELLNRYGWREAGGTSAGQGWTRPGKDTGVSGVLLDKTGNFYVWSSNASPLEPGQSYTAWGLYAAYETGGDFAEAANNLKLAGLMSDNLEEEGMIDKDNTTPPDVQTTQFDYGTGKFSLLKTGVHHTVTDKDGNELTAIWICSPLSVVAMSRSRESSEWGRLLEWKDADGVQHQWAMPMELLQGDGTEVRRELARLGLQLSTGRGARELLATYIQVWPVTQKVRCVDRLGWQGSLFVTPSDAIGSQEEKVVFQKSYAYTPAWEISGTSEDWQRNIAARAAGNSRVVFAISIAFAGTLLEIAGEESGGFHFVGRSSCGKSTTAKVAASVWGDPKKYCRQWRGTDNGLEGLASQHNDGVLILP